MRELSASVSVGVCVPVFVCMFVIHTHDIVCITHIQCSLTWERKQSLGELRGRKSIVSDQGEGTARARSWGQEQQGWVGKKQLITGGEKHDRAWGG